MPNCINYNCDPLEEYEVSLSQCGAKTRKAGASTFVFLECDHTMTSPTTQQLQAQYDAGKATVITGVKLGFNDPSAVTVPPTTSCGVEETIEYTRSANVEDYKVTIQNTLFWNSAKKRSFGGVLIFQCETEGLDAQVTWIDAEVSVAVFKKSGNTTSEVQFYAGTLSWKGLDDPLDYAAPDLPS